MSVEQVARDFTMQFFVVEKTRARLTPTTMVSGGVLPQPVPATEALKIVSGLAAAMPDIKTEVQQLTVNGNQATVKLRWSGTQTAPLSLPIPGMPTVPATGKKVSVMDGFLLTIEGDKVSKMVVESPADGGIPAALAQMGVKM
ncbi:MAG: ester cyclase [Anaerolineaceae bacterium]|nr:ester cyclase [Anaerolineaceae bacterium]